MFYDRMCVTLFNLSHKFVNNIALLNLLNNLNQFIILIYKKTRLLLVSIGQMHYKPDFQHVEKQKDCLPCE